MSNVKRGRVSREKRRAAAAARLKREREPAEQLVALDERLGVGVGAEKERARLAKKVSS